MNVTPFLIGAALIGTAVTTTGMFLFISAQRHRQQVRGSRASQHIFLATALVSVGAAITMVAWYLWPKTPDPTFDPNEILRSAPPAAIPNSDENTKDSALTGRRWVLMVWGTPSDLDQATVADELAFNGKLAKLFTENLTKHGSSPKKIETRILSREESNVLAASPKAVEILCTDHAGTLVFTLRLAGYLANEGGAYAPWREPQYRLIDCRYLSVHSETGRVIERRGDTFPYEQALRNDFARALHTFYAG